MGGATKGEGQRTEAPSELCPGSRRWDVEATEGRQTRSLRGGKNGPRCFLVFRSLLTSPSPPDGPRRFSFAHLHTSQQAAIARGSLGDRIAPIPNLGTAPR